MLVSNPTPQDGTACPIVPVVPALASGSSYRSLCPDDILCSTYFFNASSHFGVIQVALVSCHVFPAQTYSQRIIQEALLCFVVLTKQC